MADHPFDALDAAVLGLIEIYRWADGDQPAASTPEMEEIVATIPDDVISAARAAEKKWAVPASAQLAQWALESGWGAHAPGNNPFGMKPRAGRNDPSQTLPTHEVVNGRDTVVPQPFRIFPSITAAFEAHAELLATAPAYAPAMAKLPDLDGFVTAMALRYATSPLYAARLKAVIAQHRLERFDRRAA